MDSFSGSDVVGSVDHEVGSVNVVSLGDCLEQLWVVDNSLGQEIKSLFLEAHRNEQVPFEMVLCLAGCTRIP